MGDIESYREAERLYHRLTVSNPDVIQQMETLIDEYAKSRDKVYSNRAGRSILPKCDSFRERCGDNAPAVFGILLRDHLTAADWVMGEGTDGRKNVKIYYRPGTYSRQADI